MIWRELLIKYMASVIDAEGISYVDHGTYSKVPILKFTKDEIAELKTVEAQARRELGLEAES